MSSFVESNNRTRRVRFVYAVWGTCPGLPNELLYSFRACFFGFENGSVMQRITMRLKICSFLPSFHCHASVRIEKVWPLWAHLRKGRNAHSTVQVRFVTRRGQMHKVKLCLGSPKTQKSPISGESFCCGPQTLLSMKMHGYAPITFPTPTLWRGLGGRDIACPLMLWVGYFRFQGVTPAFAWTPFCCILVLLQTAFRRALLHDVLLAWNCFAWNSSP